METTSYSDQTVEVMMGALLAGMHEQPLGSSLQKLGKNPS